ncbi:MAG: DEAD/DEAH box helicase [Phycisphaerae bacterium]
MITLHATWYDGCLHLWGESASADSYAVPVDALRFHLGNHWDGLLVSGATSGQLELNLPHRGDTPVPSWVEPADQASEPVHMAATTIPSLMFAPADAVDLLTIDHARVDGAFRLAATFCYWSKAALLLLELLAGQKFVPAIHRQSATRFRGYWRIVVNDDSASSRLETLIATMPPVCRSVVNGSTEAQASGIVENFLWISADQLVRRCLKSDELAHAIVDRASAAGASQMAWLRSLVSGDPMLDDTPEACEAIHQKVQAWIGKLEPSRDSRPMRTCFQLHAPEVAEGGSDAAALPWKITVHVQATKNEEHVIEAWRLWGEDRDDPSILERPFEHARGTVVSDILHAAKHFPLLESCTDPSTGMACELSVAQTHVFLRDAVPVLKLEGFGIWLPKWWHEDQPQLQLELDIHPLDASSAAADSSLGLHTLVGYNWKLMYGTHELTDLEIESLASAKNALIPIRNEWVEVQPSEVEAALSFARKQSHGRLTVLESIRQAYFTEHADTGLPIVGLKAHGWIERLLDASSYNAQLEQVVAPIGFRGTLRPYQLTGLAWLMFLARHGLGACLADDMGLGKTIQLIALWLLEREDGKDVGPTLLIVPMSLVGNWRREIEKFGPTLRVMVHHGLERLTGKEFVDQVAHYDVVISTYGLMHRDLEHLAAVPWHRVALDEAQNIKNPAAKQTAAVRSLRAEHRLALTGTPVENRLSELWSIMEFLNPGYLGTARDFRGRFAIPIERQQDARRGQRLARLVQPFLLRRKKSDPVVRADLPEKLEMKVFCNLTREQAVLYESVVQEALGRIDHAQGIQRRGLILSALVKLKQICNHPAQFLGDGSPLPGRSGKVARLTDMLEVIMAEGERTLVFTQFRVMGRLLQEHLRETCRCGVFFLHGGTTQPDRDKMVQRFQTDEDAPPVFVLSLKAGGFGLNLTQANHVIHFDRWWNPAVEDQATDRVHRIGQHRQVQVHKFVSVGTLEERIDALIERKRALADILGTGEKWITELSTNSLREMFVLSRDAVAED